MMLHLSLTHQAHQMNIRLPIRVSLGVKKIKTYSLNLNAFRNWQHYLKNNIKQEFHRLVTPLIPTGKTYTKFRLVYTLYVPDKRKVDIANVLSIVDKNFCDTLVETGVIEDDNYEHLQEITFRFGGISPKNGYATVEVLPNDKHIDIK